MLSGVETTKDKVLRIILAGQPELNDKLNSQELIQLAQRIRLRFHLTPLSKADMQAYIQHRLEVAGSQSREIFDIDTFPLIFRFTGGVPRLINTLCDTAMLSAYGQDRDVVTVTDVESAIEELRWIEYAERSVRLPALNMDAAAERRTVLGRVLLALGGKTLLERELKLGRFVIGRTEENDLPVDSKYISRHHAQIITTMNTCILEDLNSTNGIYVRSKRVRRRVLNDGDVIRIGEHEIMYMDERQTRGKHPQPNPDDDAVPLLDQTMVQDIAEPMEHGETQVQDIEDREIAGARDR